MSTPGADKFGGRMDLGGADADDPRLQTDNALGIEEVSNPTQSRNIEPVEITEMVMDAIPGQTTHSVEQAMDVDKKVGDGTTDDQPMADNTISDTPLIDSQTVAQETADLLRVSNIVGGPDETSQFHESHAELRVPIDSTLSHVSDGGSGASPDEAALMNSVTPQKQQTSGSAPSSSVKESSHAAVAKAMVGSLTAKLSSQVPSKAAPKKGDKAQPKSKSQSKASSESMNSESITISDTESPPPTQISGSQTERNLRIELYDISDKILEYGKTNKDKNTKRIVGMIHQIRRDHKRLTEPLTEYTTREQEVLDFGKTLSAPEGALPVTSHRGPGAEVSLSNLTFTAAQQQMITGQNSETLNSTAVDQDEAYESYVLSGVSLHVPDSPDVRTNPDNSGLRSRSPRAGDKTGDESKMSVEQAKAKWGALPSLELGEDSPGKSDTPTVGVGDGGVADPPGEGQSADSNDKKPPSSDSSSDSDSDSSDSSDDSSSHSRTSSRLSYSMVRDLNQPFPPTKCLVDLDLCTHSRWWEVRKIFFDQLNDTDQGFFVNYGGKFYLTLDSSIDFLEHCYDNEWLEEEDWADIKQFWWDLAQEAKEFNTDDDDRELWPAESKAMKLALTLLKNHVREELKQKYESELSKQRQQVLDRSYQVPAHVFKGVDPSFQRLFTIVNDQAKVHLYTGKVFIEEYIKELQELGHHHLEFIDTMTGLVEFLDSGWVKGEFSAEPSKHEVLFAKFLIQTIRVRSGLYWTWPDGEMNLVYELRKRVSEWRESLRKTNDLRNNSSTLREKVSHEVALYPLFQVRETILSRVNEILHLPIAHALEGLMFRARDEREHALCTIDDLPSEFILRQICLELVLSKHISDYNEELGIEDPSIQPDVAMVYSEAQTEFEKDAESFDSMDSAKAWLLAQLAAEQISAVAGTSCTQALQAAEAERAMFVETDCTLPQEANFLQMLGQIRLGQIRRTLLQEHRVKATFGITAPPSSYRLC